MTIDIVAILNILMFFTMLWIVKSFIDSPYILGRHPYMKKPTLRFLFIAILISQLAATMKPELYYIATASLYINTLIAIFYIFRLYQKHTFRVTYISMHKDD